MWTVDTYKQWQGDRIINRASLRQAIDRRDQSIDRLKRQALDCMHASV